MSSKIAKYTIKCRKTLETLPAICYNVTKYIIFNTNLKITNGDREYGESSRKR